MNRHSLTAKQREELYIVGSIIWFANDTMAAQRLAIGSKSACEKYAETVEHPIPFGAIVDALRPPQILVVTEAEWRKLLDIAARCDGEGRH